MRSGESHFPRWSLELPAKVLGSFVCPTAGWLRFKIGQSQQRTHLSRFQTWKINYGDLLVHIYMILPQDLCEEFKRSLGERGSFSTSLCYISLFLGRWNIAMRSSARQRRHCYACPAPPVLRGLARDLAMGQLFVNGETRWWMQPWEVMGGESVTMPQSCSCVDSWSGLEFL